MAENQENQEFKFEDIPEEFTCVITMDLMKDPVIASDGFTYERSGIEELLRTARGPPRSPRTNVQLANQNLTPNRGLQLRIKEWMDSRKTKKNQTSEIIINFIEKYGARYGIKKENIEAILREISRISKFIIEYSQYREVLVLSSLLWLLIFFYDTRLLFKLTFSIIVTFIEREVWTKASLVVEGNQYLLPSLVVFAAIYAYFPSFIPTSLLALMIIPTVGASFAPEFIKKHYPIVNQAHSQSIISSFLRCLIVILSSNRFFYFSIQSWIIILQISLFHFIMFDLMNHEEDLKRPEKEKMLTMCLPVLTSLSLFITEFSSFTWIWILIWCFEEIANCSIWHFHSLLPNYVLKTAIYYDQWKQKYQNFVCWIPIGLFFISNNQTPIVRLRYLRIAASLYLLKYSQSNFISKPVNNHITTTTTTTNILSYWTTNISSIHIYFLAFDFICLPLQHVWQDAMLLFLQWYVKEGAIKYLLQANKCLSETSIFPLSQIPAGEQQVAFIHEGTIKIGKYIGMDEQHQYRVNYLGKTITISTTEETLIFFSRKYRDYKVALN
jgi:hypothetical protein